jgi:hypothetical protein
MASMEERPERESTEFDVVLETRAEIGDDAEIDKACVMGI